MPVLFVSLLFGCATMEVAPESDDAAHSTEIKTGAEEFVVFGKAAEEKALFGSDRAAGLAGEFAIAPERDLIAEKIEQRQLEAAARKRAAEKARAKPAKSALAELEGGEKLRVLVLSGRKTIRVNGAKGTGSGVNITRLSATTARVNKKTIELPVRLAPTKEFVYLNGRPYRGVIDLYAGDEGLLAVNELYLEPYIVGLINYEISSKWPEAAVKAQAIVARTYALHQKNRTGTIGIDERYDLDGSVLGQVYKGANAEDSLAFRAVKATLGAVLTYRGRYALTVYHSNAGGMTESSANVWTTGYPYLRTVKSPYDKDAPGYKWEYAITPKKLALRLKRAGHRIGRPEILDVTKRTRSGRVHRIEILGTENPITISGKEFREAIGYDFIKSTRFETSRRGSLFFFTGTGLGHGVGLSQWGAKGMAADGYSYKEILQHYYPGTRLGVID